jgi:hypothetical protein
LILPQFRGSKSRQFTYGDIQLQSWAVAHCADAIHSGVAAVATLSGKKSSYFMPKVPGANQDLHICRR